MNRYETVFVLTPVLSEEQAAQAAAKFRSLLIDLGCRITYEERWGLKQAPDLLHKERLAPLEKVTGHYRLFEYETADSGVVKELEFALKRDEGVLRFVTVRLG